MRNNIRFSMLEAALAVAILPSGSAVAQGSSAFERVEPAQLDPHLRSRSVTSYPPSTFSPNRADRDLVRYPGHRRRDRPCQRLSSEWRQLQIYQKRLHEYY